nr:uncharacterized protein LOC109183154 [Ipomoea trifida]
MVHGVTRRVIDSFHDLVIKFTTPFMCRRKTKTTSPTWPQLDKNMMNLVSEFLTWWQEKVVEVEGMDDKLAITMFIVALRVGDLYKSLKRKIPTDYVVMIAKANWYAIEEEIY